MKSRLTTEEVRQLLKDMTKTRTQKEVAAALGVSSTYLNELILGTTEFGPKIQKALGLRRVVLYERES